MCMTSIPQLACSGPGNASAVSRALCSCPRSFASSYTLPEHSHIFISRHRFLISRILNSAVLLSNLYFPLFKFIQDKMQLCVTDFFTESLITQGKVTQNVLHLWTPSFQPPTLSGIKTVQRQLYLCTSGFQNAGCYPREDRNLSVNIVRSNIQKKMVSTVLSSSPQICAAEKIWMGCDRDAKVLCTDTYVCEYSYLSI